MLNSRWKNVALIGAAGKMGKSIALLLAQEVARVEAEETGNCGEGSHCLHLVDIDSVSLYLLKKNLRPQIQLFAERNINSLRKYFSSNRLLISNGEVIDAFVEGALDNIRLDSDLASVKDSFLIFEATLEDVSFKIDLFRKLKETCTQDAIYLTNTSSIPLSTLNKHASLNRQIIGFHFYNPPAVQKLVELIPLDQGKNEILLIAEDAAKRLGKTTVLSRDISGFIGNGHFIREVAFACDLAMKMSENMPLYEAIDCVNYITKEFLIRPMGIFQLIDYVGIDICKKIASIMSEYLKGDNLSRELIERMYVEGRRGGQNFDGSQKEGFYHYQHLAPDCIYDLETHKNIVLKEKNHPEKRMGSLPSGHQTWKAFSKDPAKGNKLTQYLSELLQAKSEGAQVAYSFLYHSQVISEKLVEDQVAANLEDVTKVLEMGFYHLYGPSFSVLRNLVGTR